MRDLDGFKTSLRLLHFQIQKRRVNRAREMYVVLKEKYHLPPVEDVADSLGSDHIFRNLYLEMWYRRLSRPTPQERIACWENYCNLFKSLCPGEGLNMLLPNQWLWDLVDQFVNRFLSVCEFQAKETLTEEQKEFRAKETLTEEQKAWSVFSTLSLLRTMVRDSSICQTIQHQTVKTDCLECDMPSALGYFAKLGLLRVHCLLGQYRTGLKRLQPIDIFKPGFYTCLFDTETSIVYHCAFANFMLERYDEAVRILNKFLRFFCDEDFEYSRDYQQIQSRIRQLYALLAVCYVFCCGSQDVLLDEYVEPQLMKRHSADIRISQKYLFCPQDNLVDADVPSSQKSSKPKSFHKLLKRAWPEFGVPFEPDSYSKSWLCRPNPDEKMLESMYPQECLPFDPDDKEPYLSHNQHDQWIDTLIATTSISELKLT